MKRRDLLTSVLVAGLATPVIGDQKTGKVENEGHGGHGNNNDDDGRKHKNVVVSFGHWRPVPGVTPIDRFAPNDPNPRTLNGHELIPKTVRIHVGDTVNFIIAGFHNPQVFGPGTQPSDIDRTNIVPGSAPPLINDPRNRVFRGLDPRTQPQDRVEVVGFTMPGTYLVICGVLPHFFEAATGNFVMFGFVEVRDND
jgi:plastocyanin